MTHRARLPSSSNAILVQIADNVKVDERAAEISNKTFTMFKEFQMQKAGISRWVGSDGLCAHNSEVERKGAEFRGG